MFRAYMTKGGEVFMHQKMFCFPPNSEWGGGGLTRKNYLPTRIESYLFFKLFKVKNKNSAH